MQSSPHDTLGATFIGLAIASLLHGISIVQGWLYYSQQRDPLPLKALVYTVIFLDSVHQALITHTVYTYAVTYWGSLEGLDTIVWSMLVEVLFNGLTAFLVQSFLTMRVWRLSNRGYFITGLIAALVLGELGCVLAYTVLSLRLRTYEQLEHLKFLSIAVNALAAAGDVLIASALCIRLHVMRTGFLGSNRMINKLILFAVNTGLLTSLCAIGSLVSILVAGNTFLYIAFFFCIGRFYTNSLLANLNARSLIGRTGGAIYMGSVEISDNIAIPFHGSRTSRLDGPGACLTHIPIKLDTIQEFSIGPGHTRKSEETGVMAGMPEVDEKCAFPGE